MTRRTLELALLLPKEAECAGCVAEVGRELDRVDGVEGVTADVSRGLLSVEFDEAALSAQELETFARRAGAQAHCDEHCPLAVHEHGPLDLHLPLAGEEAAQRRVLHVTGMDCADCARKLQAALRREEGMLAADVNFGAATLTVTLDPDRLSIDDVYRAVQRLGYDTLERRAAAAPAAAPRLATSTSLWRVWLADRRAQFTLVAGALVAAGFAAQLAGLAAAPWLFLAAVPVGGVFVARAAVFSLRGRQVDMNVLMSLAVIGAVAIGQWSEAGLTVFLFGLGTSLQAATLERTRNAIRSLMALSPPSVTLLSNGAEVSVAAAEVVPGDRLLVRPGERLAVDGTVLEGQAGANQAPITGESSPVAKGPGDQVFAGSIVERGSLVVQATSSAADNTIARIVHLVEEAQARQAPSQALVDRFAARYTPIVVAVAAAVAFIPPLLGQSFDTWFYRGLAILIISCPCALVISTPVSILAALSRATRDGVLIKGGICLEQAAKLRAMAFDKTGTLTAGRPEVTDVVALRDLDGDEVLALAALLERRSEHPLARAIVAAAEAGEEDECTCATGHDDDRCTCDDDDDGCTCEEEECTCATGHDGDGCTCGGDDACCGRDDDDECCACADERDACGCGDDDECGCATGPDGDGCTCDDDAAGCGCDDDECCACAGGEDRDACGCAGHVPADFAAAAGGRRVERFRAIPGMGVRAEVDGRLYFVGRPDLLGPAGAEPPVAAAVAALERDGKTVVVVGDEDGALGVIGVSDPLRPGAAEALAQLKQMGIAPLTMLTGDNPETAAAVARLAGVDDVRAGLLPADKLAAVTGLRQEHGSVAMVGDGVNDAPALAAATIGVAMGGAGTDAALETADIVLMGDDLAALPRTVALARRTTRVIWENVAVSLAVKAVFLVLAPLGFVTLWLAVFADMGTSLLVTGNGLRLLRRRGREGYNHDVPDEEQRRGREQA
jgi:cation transport ATPase